MRFDQLVAAALRIGFVPNDQQEFIQNLYKTRNNVYIRGAASKQFEPDNNESSEAFKNLSRFIRHCGNWGAQQK